MATILKEPETQETRSHRWEVKRGRRNVGGPERGVRLGVGAGALAVTSIVTQPWLQTLMGIVGLAALITGAAGYCPINRAAGRDSYHHPG